MPTTHSPGQFPHTYWAPVTPPRSGLSKRRFHAYMLLPGLSLAFHAAALCRSRTAVARYRTDARAAAKIDPDLTAAVDAMMKSISAEDGVRMAQMRGRAQLPYWSRIAMFEFRKRGYSRGWIARTFQCSSRTVTNVLQGRGIHSPDRHLSAQQRHPPGQRRKTH